MLLALTFMINRGIRDSEQGAAVVEFAIVALLLFAIVFFVVDAGIALHRHLRLTHATTEITRALSARVGELSELAGSGPIKCVDVLSWSSQVADNYKISNPGIAGDYQFSIKQLERAGAVYPLVTVEGKWDGVCITCNLFTAGQNYLQHVLSVLVIESKRNIDCSQPGCNISCSE